MRHYSNGRILSLTNMDFNRKHANSRPHFRVGLRYEDNTLDRTWPTINQPYSFFNKTRIIK